MAWNASAQSTRISTGGKRPGAPNDAANPRELVAHLSKEQKVSVRSPERTYIHAGPAVHEPHVNVAT